MDKFLEQNNLIARWMAGTLTEEEQAQLADREDLEDLQYLVNDIATWSLNPLEVEQAWQTLKEKRAVRLHRPKQKLTRIWWGIAAVLLVLVMVYIGRNLLAPTDKTIITGIAEAQDIRLPDASTIRLAAMSRVSYDSDNWPENRVINLSGQAYFDVTDGQTFQVNTASGAITVIGTRFNVKQGPNRLWVACYEGKVRVQAGESIEMLIAGEAAKLESGALRRITHTETGPDWLQGMNRYEQAPLSEVIEDLLTYYPIKIDLPNRYAALQYSGRFTHSDLDNALKSIFVPMGIEYTLDADGRVLFDP